MPSLETFSIPPISRLLDRWLDKRTIIVDPFARSSKRGTLTNDLDPAQPTCFNMEAAMFCSYLLGSGLIGPTKWAHAVLFDPPYSPRQISESYKSIGRTVGVTDTQNARLYKEVRDGLDALMAKGSVAVSCGWNSAGFGKERGYRVEEILLVAHGGAHNDTIVVVESKI